MRRLHDPRSTPPERATPTAKTAPGYDAAFAEAYHTYYSRVFAYIYARTREPELAKDLTAEVFIRAYTRGHSLREAQAFAGWLFAIARNVTAAHYRTVKRQTNGMERLKDSLHTASPPDDPSDLTIRREQIETIMRHFSSLTEREQNVISLRFDAGLSTIEIAAATGLSPVSVRVSIFRALTKLRDRVRAEAGEAPVKTERQTATPAPIPTRARFTLARGATR